MGIKLVIVDDAAFIREALKNIVENAGMKCVGEAADGFEAYEEVISKNPDVVVMDLVMPNENGIEATKRILDECPGVRVVACSTESEKAMTLKAMEAGCNGFITKPFQKDDVVKAIQEAVSN